MNKDKSRIGHCALLAVLVGLSMSADAATKLQQIKVNPLLAGQLELELQFDQPVKSFADRLKYQPNQLVLQINDAESALLNNPMPVERQGVQQVSVAPAGANLDVAVALNQLMPY